MIAGIWWYASSNHKPAVVKNNSQQNQSVQAVAPKTGGLLVTSPTDNSDAALSKDLSAIDSQIKILNADFNSIDQSLNQ